MIALPDADAQIYFECSMVYLSPYILLPKPYKPLTVYLGFLIAGKIRCLASGKAFDELVLSKSWLPHTLLIHKPWLKV